MRIYGRSRQDTRVYALKKRTTVILEPAFFGREVLRMGRMKDGPEVSNMFRWCSPSVFRRGKVKGMQGTHEDFKRLCRKEE